MLRKRVLKSFILINKNPISLEMNGRDTKEINEHIHNLQECRENLDIKLEREDIEVDIDDIDDMGDE